MSCVLGLTQSLQQDLSGTTMTLQEFRVLSEPLHEKQNEYTINMTFIFSVLLFWYFLPDFEGSLKRCTPK